MSVKIDLTGKRFGSLTVLKLAEDIPGKKKKWLCKCDCGNEAVVQGGNLQSGHTQHCLKCGYKLMGKANTTHGHTKTSLYYTWADMIDRCENKKNGAYNDYGGRGICICEEWHNAEIFIKWANENGYRKGLQIDRINNNGNYEPSNCRWVTRVVNANNKRSNIFIEHNGEKRTIAEWARYYDVNYKYLDEKINKGLTLNEAVEKYRKYKSKTVKGLLERNGRYSVKITVNKKVYCIGTFGSFDEAKEARKKAELEHWGFSNIE